MGQQDFFLDKFLRTDTKHRFWKGGGRPILKFYKQEKGILFANLNLINGRGCFHYPLSIVILLFYRWFFISSQNSGNSFLKIQFSCLFLEKGRLQEPPCPGFFQVRPYSNKSFVVISFFLTAFIVVISMPFMEWLKDIIPHFDDRQYNWYRNKKF